MREIFQYKKGKDFYRDSLEYFEYNPEQFPDPDSDTEADDMDDDEISYYISQKLYKHKYE